MQEYAENSSPNTDDDPRGHSSDGRAVGLQPTGRRFDPGWLHSASSGDSRRRDSPQCPIVHEVTALVIETFVNKDQIVIEVQRYNVLIIK